MFTSKNTTLAGIAGALATIFIQAQHYFDGNPETILDWNVVALAITTLFMGIKARDNKVPSEKAGAK